LAEARRAADAAPPDQREGLVRALDGLEQAMAAIGRQHGQADDEDPEGPAAARGRPSLEPSAPRELDALCAILNSITDEVWVCDADSNIVLTNNAASGLGFEAVQEEFRSIREIAATLEIYGPDGRPRAVEDAPLLRSLRGETIRDLEEIVVNPQTGGKMVREVSTAPIRDEAGQITGAVGVARDITERVDERAAELHRTEARLRMVAEQLPAILWTTDTDLQITSSMGAGLATLNMKPGDMDGTSLHDQIRGDPANTAVRAHVRALKGESVSYEREIQGRTWSAHVEPLRNQDDRIIGCIGVGFDVTEQKAMEAQLRHATQMSALGRMAAGIAHEIGNPLASISARVQRLRNRREPEFLDKTVQLLEDQVARISRIVRTVSSIAQTQRKELRDCRLDSVLEQTTEFLRADQRSRGVEILLNLPASLPTFRG